jgi:circadian clock protein KaiC
VRTNALTLGWDLAQWEREGQFYLDARVEHDTVIAGSFDLKGLLAIIDGIIQEIGARRLALDAIDVALRFYNDPAREREQLFVLNDWLLERGITTAITVKRSEGQENSFRYEFLDYLADCVIHLDQRVADQVTTRRLRVVKYRGSDYGRNEFPYVTTCGGLRVIPISTTELRHKPLGESVTSGHPALDETLGGGYRQAACVLIAGASGTGKTTLASTFARAACERGERVLYISFEESVEGIISAMMSSQTDLRPAIRSGALRTLTAMPEAMGAEEHLVRIIDALLDFSPQHAILDAISAARRFGNERAGFDFLVRLLYPCRERGITVLVLNQTPGAVLAGSLSGEEVSSVVDTIVFLRYVEVGGETNRVVSVVKSRGSAHSNQIREFRITASGIDFAKVYTGEGGVLTGAARQEQEALDAVELRRHGALIEAKQREIARRKAELESENARLAAAIGQAEAELQGMELEQIELRESRRERGSLRIGASAPEEEPSIGG